MITRSSRGRKYVTAREMPGSQYGVKRSKPLQRVLEESIFERCLKRARLGLADSKSGTDFELRRAINFHVFPAALLERSAHRV